MKSWDSAPHTPRNPRRSGRGARFLTQGADLCCARRKTELGESGRSLGRDARHPSVLDKALSCWVFVRVVFVAGCAPPGIESVGGLEIYVRRSSRRRPLPSSMPAEFVSSSMSPFRFGEGSFWRNPGTLCVRGLRRGQGEYLFPAPAGARRGCDARRQCAGLEREHDARTGSV